MLAVRAEAYPLDGWEETGIDRLKAYDLARDYLLRMGQLKPGALRGLADIRLALLDRAELSLPESSPELSDQIRGQLGEEADVYGVSLLDLSDPDAPRYAEHNPLMVQNPGSVGKLVVLLAWFQALADLYPDDVEARHRLLRDTVVAANEFIRNDHHVVPVWHPGEPRVKRRPIAEGDRANLWTFMDWTASASSNAGASMLMAHLILLKHFGTDYPVSDATAAAFLADTPREQLQAIYTDAIQTPLARNGIDFRRFRQGKFFTREGQRRFGGTNSVVTARELTTFMMLLEQGKLVDPWSSLQIKRLLYLTDWRIRYAGHAALNDAAVYYKSGSLYSCRPEPGFTCERNAGNRLNFMNSVAIIERESEGRRVHYIVSVLSNVLRKNSVQEHRELAARIHELVLSTHEPVEPLPAADPL
jgi:hypothetical protein